MVTYENRLNPAYLKPFIDGGFTVEPAGEDVYRFVGTDLSGKDIDITITNKEIVDGFGDNFDMITGISQERVQRGLDRR